MTHQQLNNLQEFFDLIGLMEEPIGIFYTDNKPAEGFSPKPMDLPTREKEKKTRSTGRTFSANSPALWETFGEPGKRKVLLISVQSNPVVPDVLFGSAS